MIMPELAKQHSRYRFTKKKRANTVNVQLQAVLTNQIPQHVVAAFNSEFLSINFCDA